MQVVDVDDNAPEFAVTGPLSIVIGVSEAVGRPLGLFPAFDKDGAAPNNVVVITATPSDLGDLTLNSTTGELTVAKSPLTEKSYSITLSARSGGGKASPSNLQVRKSHQGILKRIPVLRFLVHREYLGPFPTVQDEK